MWHREAAIFTAYASFIVYVVAACLSLLMGGSSSPGDIDPIMMLPLTMITVFITASIYLSKNRLARESHGAALGAFSAFAVYCATVFCLMAVFYSSVQYWSEQGKAGQVPGALGFYAIVLSPVLLPVALLFGAGCGIAYMRVKSRFGLVETTHRPLIRRRRRVGLVVALTALVVIAVPMMYLIGGPAFLMFGGAKSISGFMSP